MVAAVSTVAGVMILAGMMILAGAVIVAGGGASRRGRVVVIVLPKLVGTDRRTRRQMG